MAGFAAAAAATARAVHSSRLVALRGTAPAPAWAALKANSVLALPPMQLPPAPPLVVVISGPSGVGKDAVIKRLQERRPDLYFVVTATSR